MLLYVEYVNEDLDSLGRRLHIQLGTPERSLQLEFLWVKGLG